MKFFSALQWLVSSLLIAGWPSAQAQVSYTCDRPSENDAGNYMEQVTSLGYCLDSDPLPGFLFDSSDPLNTSARVQANGGAPVFFHLEAGEYIYANGSNIGTIYVYEKTCPVPTTQRGLKPGGSSGKGTMMKKKQMMGMMKAKGTYEKEEEEETLCYGAVLFDAPEAFGLDFGEFIYTNLAALDATLDAIIVSHAHLDHSGNVESVLAANPTVKHVYATKAATDTYATRSAYMYGNPRLNEILSSNPQFPSYDITDILEEEQTLVFGNQTFEIKAAPGHTEGNILLFHEASGTLINIDSLVFPKWAPFFEFAVAGDVITSLMLFDEYRGYDYRYFISGHLTHIGTPSDVDTSEAFMVDVVDASFGAFAAAAANSGSSANFFNIFGNTVNLAALPNAGNIWQGLGEWLNQVSYQCADTVLDPTKNYSGTDWISALGGVRSTIFSHCRTLADVLRVESPGFGISRRR